MWAEAEHGEFPSREQLQALLALAVALHREGHSLLWPGLLVDVLYRRTASDEERWTVGEELALKLLLPEIAKALGLTLAGAEIWFQEVCPGLPRVVRFLQRKGVEELLWLIEDEEPEGPEIRRVEFSDLDVLHCVNRVIRGQIGWRRRARERAALAEVQQRTRNLRL